MGVSKFSDLPEAAWSDIGFIAEKLNLSQDASIKLCSDFRKIFLEEMDGEIEGEKLESDWPTIFTAGICLASLANEFDLNSDMFDKDCKNNDVKLVVRALIGLMNHWPQENDFALGKEGI